VMARSVNSNSGVSLRRARSGDYAFALGLYLASVRPLLTKLGRWDEDRVLASLQNGFKPATVRIIRQDGLDIGWMQVSDTATGFHLHQIHLMDGYRNRGLGTGLIKELQERARNKVKPITLNVIHGNPALDLYLRLGFRVVGEDEDKLHMRWRGRRSVKG